VESNSRALRLSWRAEAAADEDRAALVVDRLAARREVSGGPPDWVVLYEDLDTDAALRQCAADLTAIEGGWPELLDLSAAPSRPIADPEFI
jgi:hypothetical protein